MITSTEPIVILTRAELELHKTDRIDCYRVVADGVEWKERIGWSKILAGLRKSMPMVSVT